MNKLQQLTKYQLRKIKQGTANWINICKNYYLTEDFIRKYQNYVDWWSVCSY